MAVLDIDSIGHAAAQSMCLKEAKAEEPKKARLEDLPEALASTPAMPVVPEGAFGWLLRDASGYTFVSPRQALFACDNHTIEISALDVLPEEFAQHEVVLEGPSSKIVVSVGKSWRHRPAKLGRLPRQMKCLFTTPILLPMA